MIDLTPNQESNESIEPNIKELIKSSLNGLEEKNKEAHSILVSQVEQGFFHSRKTDRPLKGLMNELLKTISNGDKSAKS